MSVIAGVDIGNATTEIVVLQDGRLVAAERMATRGRKGSADNCAGRPRWCTGPSGGWV